MIDWLNRARIASTASSSVEGGGILQCYYEQQGVEMGTARQELDPDEMTYFSKQAQRGYGVRRGYLPSISQEQGAKWVPGKLQEARGMAN